MYCTLSQYRSQRDISIIGLGRVREKGRLSRIIDCAFGYTETLADIDSVRETEIQRNGPDLWVKIPRRQSYRHHGCGISCTNGDECEHLLL